jgi:hypothetical protein
VKGARELWTVDRPLEIEMGARYSGEEATAAEGGRLIWSGQAAEHLSIRGEPISNMSRG